MVLKTQQSLSNNQTTEQYILPRVGCIRGDIVFPIHDQSIYVNSIDQLGFLVTKTLGSNSKPLNHKRKRIICSSYTQI